MALRMLKEGDPDDKISRLTGMTKKELALLKRRPESQEKEVSIYLVTLRHSQTQYLDLGAARTYTYRE